MVIAVVGVGFSVARTIGRHLNFIWNPLAFEYELPRFERGMDVRSSKLLS